MRRCSELPSELKLRSFRMQNSNPQFRFANKSGQETAEEGFRIQTLHFHTKHCRAYKCLKSALKYLFLGELWKRQAELSGERLDVTPEEDTCTVAKNLPHGRGC